MQRTIAAIAPLALTLLFAWAAMGPMNFGAGEKDIFVAVPLLVWSVTYLLGSVVLGWRGAGLRRTLLWSAGVATGVLAGCWLALAAYVLLSR